MHKYVLRVLILFKTHIVCHTKKFADQNFAAKRSWSQQQALRHLQTVTHMLHQTDIIIPTEKSSISVCKLWYLVEKQQQHWHSYRNHQSFFCKQLGLRWCLLEEKKTPTDTATEITNHFTVNRGGWGDVYWGEKTHWYSYRNHQSFICKQWWWGWCLLEKTHPPIQLRKSPFICKQWGWGVGGGGAATQKGWGGAGGGSNRQNSLM